MADGTHAMADDAVLPKAASISGADYIAGVLKVEGVKQIIGFPASELFDASAALDIPPVIARTQRVAVNIAEGYARATAGKELAVVTVQYGPGAESAFAGIAQAFNDRVPMLFLPTGYPRGSEAVAPNFESRRNFRHITKWCEAATRVADLPKLMHAAISRVRNGPPAPVLLELPVDLLAERLDALPADHRRPARSVPQADGGEVVALVETLLAAKNPVILAGQGILSASATTALVELAELLKIPVMTTPNGKSGFPEDHPLALGTAGRARPATVDHFLDRADVVLALGSSLTRSYYILPISDDKVILQVTLDAADLGKDYPIAQGLIGDVGLVLKQIVSRIRDTRHTVSKRPDPTAEIAAQRAAFMAKWMPLLRSDSRPISPYRVVWELMQAVDPKTSIITHDAGNPRDQLCPFYVATVPGSYIGWGKTTQLGSSLGFGIGAKLARPEATVVNVMGESAFGMVAIDFETAVRSNLPVLTVVLRNNVLGGYAKSMPVATQKYGANRMTGSYAPIAEALGGHGICVTEPEALRPALLAALDRVRSGQACLLEIVTHEEPRLAGLS
ncbi:thiamine pyrophosphate-requiring protein [Rhizobium bangladeshense]|uniref:thiamine pyrophosphate-requiring protein n=1 Tax=Rhizobium bangladeshense TaxID=1138189 RepID=UPI001C82C8A5|nr:thiamine pyrophosphate-requiring protein [Rhizobium bangladeshense]MBX4898776.1 thiamine pyrophosphate-requiring protein [Rhizobium bangladeshense]MBX4920710.1 thiamine pyrophosphate-requiring protein [Rhizobium bangladeshense]MBY3616927.1 thiamine pyrophosphate-requiring protein [Rhizobium bangladeshense]